MKNEITIINKSPLYRKVWRSKQKRYLYVIDLRSERFWDGKKVISSWSKSKTDTQLREIKSALKSKRNINIYDEYHELNSRLSEFKTNIRNVVVNYLKSVNENKITFRNLINEYDAVNSKLLKSGPSLETTKSVCKVLAESSLGSVTLNELDKNKIESYFNDLKVSSRTKINRLRRIRAILTYGRKAGINTAPDPTGLIKFKLENIDPDTITTSQLIQMLSETNDRVIKSIIILKSYGIRSSEVMGINYAKSLNLEKQTLLITNHVAKTGRSRIIPLADTSFNEWFHYLGGMKCFDSIDSKAIRKYNKYISRFQFGKNYFRHTAITNQLLRSNFKSIDETALIMGNSGSTIRRHYLGVCSVQNDKKDAEKWFQILPNDLTTI